MKPLGSVNPCVTATIYVGQTPVARCYDTPNARAHAFRKHENATHAIVHYPGFKPERIARHDWDGSPMTDSAIGYVKF